MITWRITATCDQCGQTWDGTDIDEARDWANYHGCDDESEPTP